MIYRQSMQTDSSHTSRQVVFRISWVLATLRLCIPAVADDPLFRRQLTAVQPAITTENEPGAFERNQTDLLYLAAQPASVTDLHPGAGCNVQHEPARKSLGQDSGPDSKPGSGSELEPRAGEIRRGGRVDLEAWMRAREPPETRPIPSLEPVQVHAQRTRSQPGSQHSGPDLHQTLARPPARLKGRSGPRAVGR